MERAGELVPCAMYVLDRPSLEVRWHSPFLARALGYAPAELAALEGHLVERLLHPADRERLPGLVERWSRAADDAVLEEELRLLHRDGRYRWFLGRERAYERDAEGGVCSFLGILIDVTERKRLELRVQQAARLEALGRVTGGVAHDFSNFLTAILGHAGLARELAHEGDAPRGIEEIERTAVQARELIGLLLSIARHEAPEREPLELDAAVAEYETLLRTIVGRDVAVSLELGSPGAEVRLARSELAQLLVNLALNASEAMPRGGHLRVATRPAGADPAEDGAAVLLSIEDDGAGMDAETLESVFEPFFSTKDESRSGAGLGLATVQRIVQGCGGRVDVHSTPGEGTRFELRLPRVG